MFDWLFGDGGKEMDKQKSALDAQLESQTYNRDMANAMTQILSDPNNSDLITQAGSDYTGDWLNQAKGMRASVNRNQSSVDDMQKQYDAAEKSDRYNYFGNGLLGALLNPIGQTATAGFDLATGQYENNDRDMWSDIGAAGQTALSFLPFAGGLARAGGAVGKIGAGVGKAANSIPGMAGVSAGFNVGENIRQNGAETDLSQLPGEALSGAAFGAAIPIVGRAGGKFLKNRGAKQVAEKFMLDPSNARAAGQLQEAGGGAVNSLVRDIAGRERNNLAQRYGGLYQNALGSMIPKSTVGKLAVGGGALYGGSQLMGMGGGEQPAVQYSSPEIEQIAMELAGQNGGVPPSEYEIMQLMQMQGGY